MGNGFLPSETTQPAGKTKAAQFGTPGLTLRGAHPNCVAVHPGYNDFIPEAGHLLALLT